MKVWKVLGGRNRFARDTIIVVAAFALLGNVLVSGRARLFSLLIFAAIGWMTSFFVKRALNDRDDWLFIVYRALFDRAGTYSLFDPPRRKE